MHRTSARRRHLARTFTIEIRPAADALEAFRRSFKALAAGQRVPRQDRVSVASIQAAWNLLTGTRLALLRIVRTQHPGSIEEVAQIVSRNLKDVHRDIRVLEEHGLIRMSRGRGVRKCRASIPSVPFDQIVLKIGV
jgi:predicted transcriptional regulator